jgi:hypothetical protein
MDLPIDISSLAFICAGQAEAVVDYDSRRPKLDPNGVPLFQLNVVVLSQGAAEVLRVKVPGQPQGLTSGSPVTVDGLVAVPYSIGDKSGVAYRARTITPTVMPAPVSGAGRDGGKGGAIQ